VGCRFEIIAFKTLKIFQQNVFWWTCHTTGGHCKIRTVAVEQNTYGFVRTVEACRSFTTLLKFSLKQ